MKTLTRIRSRGFEDMKAKFSKSSEAKPKKGVFVGPQNIEPLKDKDFFFYNTGWDWTGNLSMTLGKQILGNKSSLEFRNEVRYLLDSYAAIGRRHRQSTFLIHSRAFCRLPWSCVWWTREPISSRYFINGTTISRI